jgi:hypothetical protein
MTTYSETRSQRNPQPRPPDAELLAIPAVRAIRRRVNVSPIVALTIAALGGMTVEAR